MLRRYILLFILGLFALNTVYAQGFFSKKEKKTEKGEIEWLSFEEAVKRNKKHPRKFIIDVYTDWCGWCKRMDATSFKDSAVIEYVGKKYYAVKLNAETKDSIQFDGKVFKFRPEYKSNELALSLLNGKMSYPTTVYMDENVAMLSPVPGYLPANTLQMILTYYGENAHKTTPWDKYQKEYEENKSKKAVPH